MQDFFYRHHYQLIKLLREQSQSNCYLVKNIIDSQLYTIEQIQTSFLQDYDIQILKDQIQQLQNLSHKNIAKPKQSFYDAIYGLNIVKEYAEEGNLEKKIKQQKCAFSQEKIADWLWQLCLGLNYLHENKHIHRSITTKNILILKQGSVKLEITNIINCSKNTARTLIQNHNYMPPQTLEGKKYTSKSDIWSLGVCAYQLCCLKRPFQSNKISTFLLKTKGSIPEINHKYSKQLRNIIYEMLNITPYQRPSTQQLIRKPIFAQYRFQLLKIASFKSINEIKLEKIQNFKQKFLKSNKNNIIRNQLTFKSKKNDLKCIVSPKNKDFNPPITPKYSQYPKTNRQENRIKIKNTFTPPLKKCLKSLSTVTPISNKNIYINANISQKTKKDYQINKNYDSKRNKYHQKEKITQVETYQTTRKTPKLIRSRCISSLTYGDNQKINTYRQENSIQSQGDGIQQEIQSIKQLIVSKVGQKKFNLISKQVKINNGFCSQSGELIGLFSLWYGLKIRNIKQHF